MYPALVLLFDFTSVVLTWSGYCNNADEQTHSVSHFLTRRVFILSMRLDGDFTKKGMMKGWVYFKASSYTHQTIV